MNFHDPARLLLVDEDSSPSLKTGLEIYGFEVVAASDGVKALTQFREHNGNYDAIVTDHDAPRMDGLEFVRAVRQIGFQGRIVVMSENLSVEDLRSYQECGINGFFHKPLDAALLATLLLQD